MSTLRQHAYRFATSAQWQRCLVHGFDVGKEGKLVPMVRLGTRPTPLAEDDGVSKDNPVSAIATDPYGRPLWRSDKSVSEGSATLSWSDELVGAAGPYEVEAPLATTPRLIVDRRWLWAFHAACVYRYDRETLQLDLTIDLNALCDAQKDTAYEHPVRLIDIASDGHEGVWILVRSKSGGDWLLHFNCEGCPDRRFRTSCDAGPILEIGIAAGGKSLVLLEANGPWLRFVDAADGTSHRAVRLGSLAPCWRATHFTTDGNNRIALSGTQALDAKTKTLVFLLDGSGDLLDGFPDLFVVGTQSHVVPASPVTLLNDLAVHRGTLWFATKNGVWRLDSSEACGSRESSSTLVTPSLFSPTTTSERGWLRAEIAMDLPLGAVLKVEHASTDDERVAEDAQRTADDDSTTAQSRQERLWASLPDPRREPFLISGPTNSKVPIAVPLFDSRDRWLWLRLEILTPAGTAPPSLHTLRVLYPDSSLVQGLPAVFRGERNDPGGVLRRLVGVLESTTQRIDERIGAIGASIDPETAPEDWFDYLARWLDLPWDDALPPSAKRALLMHAGELLAGRGTRAGLEQLLRCFLGDGGSVSIVDLTVDHEPMRIGGDGYAGAALPALLAGVSPRIAKLGGKAALGKAWLACRQSDCNPLRYIMPTLQISLASNRATRAAVEPLVMGLVAQYIPMGIKVSVRWRLISDFWLASGDADGDMLDANGPGVLGDDSVMGRTVLVGRSPGGIDEAGFNMGFRLK